MLKQIAVFLSLVVIIQGLTPSTFLSQSDKSRLKKLFQDSLNDESSISYGILGLKLLGENVSGDLCKKVQAIVDKEGVNSENLFAATSAAKALGASCVLKLNTQATQVLESQSSVQDLHNGVISKLNLGQKPSGASVIKSLTEALKKDDSVGNLGYAFNLAAQFAKSDGVAIFDRVEDAVVQADEINGKVLQFEGGLSVSSLIITGAYALAKVNGKPPPISKLQSVKFANYFLSRKNVQVVKGAWSLLNALDCLSIKNEYHVPLAVSLASPPAVSDKSPKVKVQITDVMGNDLGPMTVQVDSAMRQSDGAVIMSKNKMKELGSGLYEVDLMAVKPGKGFYELTLTSTPAKANAKLAGNEGAVLLVKVLGTITLEGVEIGVADADQSTQAKLSKVAHPGGKVDLKADHHHKVILKFSVKDNGAKVKVHQAFVRLAMKDSEIIYVAEPDNANNYKFDLDVSGKSKEFQGKSGKYSLNLIIGDAVVSNPIDWHLADINLQFPVGDDQVVKAEPLNKPKAEIRHLFREPEKRPPQVVSTFFTGLCLLPFGIMLLAWMKLGVNFSSFPLSLSALGFHLGLGAIFSLYYLFWLQWDMFTTLKYLMMIGVVTFLCGNSMLVGIADKRKRS